MSKRSVIQHGRTIQFPKFFSRIPSFFNFFENLSSFFFPRIVFYYRLMKTIITQVMITTLFSSISQSFLNISQSLVYSQLYQPVVFTKHLVFKMYKRVNSQIWDYTTRDGDFTYCSIRDESKANKFSCPGGTSSIERHLQTIHGLKQISSQ